MTGLLLALLCAQSAPSALPGSVPSVVESSASGPADTIRMTLAQALQAAVEHSPARLEVSATRARSTTSALTGVAALLPTPTGSLSYGRIQSQSLLQPDSTVTRTGWSGSLTLAQVVFDPEVFATVASSFVYSGYHAADARDKQALLVLNVTQSYLNLLKADRLRDVASSALARAADNLNLSRDRLRLGSASALDVMRSEVYHSQAQIDLLSAENARATANASFLATVGIEEDMAVVPVEELTASAALAFTDSDSVTAQVERLNPGAKLAAKAGAVSRLNLASAIGKALPSVSAYWSSDYSDTLLPRSLRNWTDHDYISSGIRLSFPLLDLKSYLLGIANASAQARLAQAAADKARLQLRSAATAAVLAYKESRLRCEHARHNLELNQELHRLAADQYRLGALSLLDYQSVETTLAQAQAAYVSALCDTYIQAAQIAYLLGGT